MALTKYASAEYADVLDLKGSRDKIHTASLNRIADYNDFRTDDNFLYVRIRAISSRVNQNNDGWPTVELAGSPDILKQHHSGDGFTVEASAGNPKFGFATFMHKPIFVDHNNGDPKRTRGLIVDTKFRVLDAKTAASDPYWSSRSVDPTHLPASEIELLLEIDAKNYPKFASAVKKGHIDGFSMGCNCQFSVCSHCGNKAENASEFCSHVRLKGIEHDYKTANGERIKKKSYENVGGVQFFEISGVFNPADDTALTKEIISSVKEGEFYNAEGYEDDQDPMRPNHGEPLFYPGGDGAFSQPKLTDADREIGLMMNGYSPHVDQNGMPIRNPETGERVKVLPPARPDEDLQQYNNLPVLPNQPVKNNPQLSSVHTAENELPQAMKVHAPDDLNTLRDENICPECGSRVDGNTCQVCGNVQYPKGFGNPDLDKAKEIRKDMKRIEEDNAGVGPDSQGLPGALQQQQQMPQQSPQQPSMPNKPQPTANVNNRMSWAPLVTERTAARINKVEKPVLQPNTIVTNQPSNQVVLSDQKAPVTSAMLTAQRLMATAQRNHIGESMSNTKVADGATPPDGTSAKKRVDVCDVGGFDEASNEEASKACNQVDLLDVGGTGIEGVEPDSTEELPTADPKSDDAGYNKDKTTQDSGPTKTYGDSDGTEMGFTNPVTRKPFPDTKDGVKASRAYYAAVKQAQDDYASAMARYAYEDGSLEDQDQQGDEAASKGKDHAVKGVDPADGANTDTCERVDVLEHKTTPENNSGATKTWSGTNGNGVLRQQDPVTRDPQETGGVRTPDVKEHTGAVRISSIKLADLEIELGLLNRDEKYNRIASLGDLDETIVLAQIDSYSKVKTAGLAKTASTGLTRVPSMFGRMTSAPNGFERIASDHSVPAPPAVDNAGLDAAIFIR